MSIILVLKRLLRLPSGFIYTMLPSKDNAAVYAAHVDHEEERNVDGTPETPRNRLWSRQT
jgi:hypothetical protein